MDKYKLKTEFYDRLKKETESYKGLPIAISGGIDSSTLIPFINPEFVISVTLPGGENYDESRYAETVVKKYNLKHLLVETKKEDFDEYVTEAVKAIGRPIPHFNIFPLFCMYKSLCEMGVKQLILGDGPDETMCGYGRNLIMNYLYNVYEKEAFKPYFPIINKILPDPILVYADIIGKDVLDVEELMEGKNLIQGMNRVDMELMRPDMDDMSNKIAEYFGIKNIRPYQDNSIFDEWQYNLPDEAKIHEVEYGKYLLRLLNEEYFPEEIAWRKVKRGGPVYPVNLIKGWDNIDGEFGKSQYLKYQEKILK